MAGGKAAALVDNLKVALNEKDQIIDGVKGTLSKARGMARNATNELKETHAELERLREEPFADAMVGTVIAVGGGMMAGGLDLAIGPIYNLGGEEVKDATGKVTYKGGFDILPSMITGPVTIFLGAQEKSRSILDFGKAQVSGAAYATSQKLLNGMFTK